MPCSDYEGEEESFEEEQGFHYYQSQQEDDLFPLLELDSNEDLQQERVVLNSENHPCLEQLSRLNSMIPLEGLALVLDHLKGGL